MNYITADQRKQMIKGYNALVKDYLQLGIGHFPFIEEASHIDVEALFIFQGIVAHELINYLKEDDDVERIQLQRIIKKRKRSTSTEKIEGIL